MYVSGLPKDGSDESCRRIFARFGKIISFKLVDSPKFQTSLAFVAYKYPTQAALALQYAEGMPEFEGHEVKVCWHKKKSVI